MVETMMVHQVLLLEKAHDDDAVVECYNIAGIPLPLVNTTHNSTTGGIISINSPHSYNLQISGVNAGTGIQGGGEI